MLRKLRLLRFARNDPLYDDQTVTLQQAAGNDQVKPHLSDIPEAMFVHKWKTALYLHHGFDILRKICQGYLKRRFSCEKILPVTVPSPFCVTMRRKNNQS